MSVEIFDVTGEGYVATGYSGEGYDTEPAVLKLVENGDAAYFTQRQHDALRDHFAGSRTEPEQPEQSPSSLLNDVFQIIGQRPFTLSVGNND